MDATLHHEVVAEEKHAGRVWSLAILPALFGPAISAVIFPTAPARLALGVVAVVGIPALALVLDGFQYRFLLDRVEVRTLGFCLRSIPRETILGYSIEGWSLLRGYGIRRFGNSRAYVWGNKAVHIRTTKGDVFLGHSDPERVIRDLDQLTGFVSRG
jgi:hypothetical protein